MSALAAASLASCSIALDGPAASWRTASDDVTGSIPQKGAPLSRALDQEDWRRASAALGTALDPQGDGASVNWDNPQTNARGSFTPVGQAYPMDGKICRAFVAEVGTKEARERLQGTACREKTSDWLLTEVRPWKKV